MVDNVFRICYDVIEMKNTLILLPASLVQEADNMSKETCLNFRDCLDIVVRANMGNTLTHVDRATFNKEKVSQTV